MNKNKIYFLVLGCLFFGNLYAQNEEVKRTEIISSLKLFFDNLSSVNDDFDPIPVSVFNRIYGSENVLTGGGHYFRYNGNETTLSSFIQSYTQNNIEGKNINHELDISNRTLNVKPINKNSTSDQRWQVKGMLKLTNAHFEEGNKDEDYLIKPTPFEMIVRYNGSGKEVSILEINIGTSGLQKVYPIYRNEIVFTADGKKSDVTLSADGGLWYCTMQSYSKRIKTYPGLNQTSVTLSPLDYKYEISDQRTSTKLRDIKIEKLDNNQQKLSGILPTNYLEIGRTYSLKLIQEGTNNEYVITITQSGAVKPCFWCDFFEVDNYWGLNQLNLSYSIKYGIGVAYKHHFEDSRFTLGGLISANFDTYRGITDPLVEEIPLPPISLDFTNSSSKFEEDLYEIESETVKPNTSNYNNLLDPRNEAKKYTARSLFLIQPGIDITNWFNFTLGIGVALSRDKHYLETAYGYTKYSYKKLDPSLPDIDDVYVYKAYYKDYYYKSSMKCHFAIQPSMDFRIPLGNDDYLNLGAGYVFTPGYKEGNSFDFLIGYTWEI